MKGMSVVRALSCAAKVSRGEKCTVSELAASLDTLAWAYKKGKSASRKPKNKRAYQAGRYPTRSYRRKSKS